MKLKEIVTEKLKELGADGLCDYLGDCGCPIDDLFKWNCDGECDGDCRAAKKADNGMFYPIDLPTLTLDDKF